MADEKKPAAPAAAPAAPAEDAKALHDELVKLQNENRSLQGMLNSFSPQLLAELQAKNKELVAQAEQLQKDLVILIAESKSPIDAGSAAEKFHVFKTEVLSYCNDRQVDPNLWKKLESL